MADTGHEIERDEAELALSRQKVYDFFDGLGIPYAVVDHPPIYSAADNVRKEIKIDALVCKNLFLRNKDKSQYYLFTLPIDKRADLIALQNALDETRLSFGDADALWEMLRVRPGSVSLLNIIEVGEAKLKFLVDAEVLRSPCMGVHPNDNATTITFAPDRLPEIFACFDAEFSFVVTDHTSALGLRGFP